MYHGCIVVIVWFDFVNTERVLQDGLYYEFCRFSTDVVVKMYTKSDKKWAMIKYKRFVYTP